MLNLLQNKLLWVAIIPPVVLLIYIYSMDKSEKESPGLLLNLFVRGVAACIPAVILEYAGEYVLGAFIAANDFRYNLYKAFLIVGFSEEMCKFMATRKYTWYNYEFNYRFDGVVYSVFASLGFATLENLIYVFTGGFRTGIMRALLAIPGHMIFGVYMGLFYGKSKEYAMRGCGIRKSFCLLMSVVFPAALHGLYDYCLFVGSQNTVAFFYFYIAFVYIVTFILIRRYSKNDYFLIHGKK